MTENEIEVKFLLKDLPRLELRIKALGGKLVQPRVKETNLRFDTPAGDLTKTTGFCDCGRIKRYG